MLIGVLIGVLAARIDMPTVHAQVMFGTISAFFWKHLAGITATSSGYTTIRVAPSFGELCGVAAGSSLGGPSPGDPAIGGTARRVPPLLSSLDARLDTVAGVVRVRWEVDGVDATADTTAERGADGGADGRPGPAHHGLHRPTSLNVTVPRGASTAEIVMPCVTAAATITDGLTGAVLWTDGRFVAPSPMTDAARPARDSVRVLSGTVTEFGGVSFTVRSGTYQLVRT